MQVRPFPIAVAGALTLLLGLPPGAAATCPPLAPGSSELELLAGRVPLFVYPSTGPAPLTVEIRWWSYPIPNPVRVEFDPDGDGIPEWSQPQFQASERNYIYQREGDYRFTVRVHDASGQVTTYSVPVKVLSPLAFDADLQSRWATLKANLRRGDIKAALECIHSRSRSRYQELFKALSGNLQDVDRILTAIRLVEVRRGEAIYEMTRTEGGVARSFDVRIVIDGDGVWRVRSF